MAGARSVAVLGTGIMGLPMARNLARAGLEVRAWNRTRAKAEPLAGDGVAVAGTAAEAVDGADAWITMLADGETVAEVARDALGAGDAGPWLQMSTVGLAAARELGRLADDQGATYVDAPVLGTKAPAEKGELIVLASGPDGSKETAEPIFDAVGSKTVWLGEAGNGSRMKLVVNAWIQSITAATGQSIALAEGLGLDPATFLEIMDGAPTGSPYLQLKGNQIVGDKLDEVSFSTVLARKDTGLVVDAPEEAGLEPALARALYDRFDAAVEQGSGEQDMASVYRAFRPAG
jgi:3-hydroxyisobutyrate dehydrogenase